MKGKIKSILVLVLVLTLVLAFTPFKIFAEDASTGYTITFQIADNASSQHTLENDGGHLIIDGQCVELRDENDTPIGTVTVSDDEKTAQITVTDNSRGSLNYNSANSFTLYNTNGHTPYAMDTELSSNQVFLVEDYANNSGNDDNNQTDNVPPTPGPTGGEDDIAFDIKVTNTHLNVSINNKVVMDDQDGNFKDTFNGTIGEAGTSNSNETNKLCLCVPFGDKAITEFEINGIKYVEGMDQVDIRDEGWFVTVPGASKYTIRGEADVNFVAPRTIIWVNPDYKPTDAEDAEWVSDFTMEHGTAKVIAVYDNEGNKLSEDKYTNRESDQYGLNGGFGWVKVYPGYKAVFEFVPEYGYQLTKITLNETPMAAGENVNNFTIEIPNDNSAGNVHFGATFTKTDDIVKADSEKVSSGKINLGNKLSGGSAQLTVNDVKLSSEKISGFEKAAGDYTISDYLDIDLYQVFYKGKNDSNDVWSNKIDELDNEATIAIQLAEGIDVNDIVIVHNIHDGDEYEVIQIDSYDEETRTITFKTKSFSNYAIATKASTESTTTDDENTKAEESNAESKAEVKDNVTSSPQTGDIITMVTVCLAIAVVGLGITNKSLRKSKKTSKH